jgi:hypothetical protein
MENCPHQEDETEPAEQLQQVCSGQEASEKPVAGRN